MNVMHLSYSIIIISVLCYSYPFPTGVPQHRQFLLEPALAVELIRTPICGYHYSNKERPNNISSWNYYYTGMCVLRELLVHINNVHRIITR